MNNLEIVYILRQQINQLEEILKRLTCENVQMNPEMNRRTVTRINRIEARIITLKGIQHDQIYQVYSSMGSRLQTSLNSNGRQMKIIQIDIEDTVTTLKMVPIGFKLDDKKKALKSIIYPTDGTDRNLVNIVARYRTLINKSKNFCQEPLQIGKDSTETAILVLSAFAHQYSGELSFTDEDLSFSDPITQIVSGVVNLDNIHLLVGNFIPTAKFSIKVKLDYNRDLAQSISTLKNFILHFHKALAHLLHCKNEFIRIFSIEKVDNKCRMTQINFGLTMPDKNQTESLARHFQVNHKILFLTCHSLIASHISSDSCLSIRLSKRETFVFYQTRLLSV